MNQRGYSLLIVLLILTALVGLLLYRQQARPVVSKQVVQSSASPEVTINWKTFTDSEVGYTFKYPADYVPYFKTDSHVFHSSDSKFDKITTAKISGIEIGTAFFNEGEDKEDYIGPSTKIDPILTSKMILSAGDIAKAYVNLEDIAVIIDYKKDNQNKRIMIWCGGENGNPSGCEKILTPLLPTFKFQ